MDKLLLLSGVKLAEMIRNKEVSSQEVVEAHIARIQKVNPIINAVVKDRFDQARAEAKHADETLKTIPPEQVPPFFGVPCTIKECFQLTGMPNASGLVARKSLISKEDATAVARIRKAGAIPLGVTNTSELCMWYESYNKVYGRTNNPYNPKHIVGGSSGGEGAIIGAGGSPFGIGSDIGGSIRMPAFFNGVFGHKPTGTLVPATGQHPIAENEALTYLATGPLARRAEDLMPILRIIAGPDGKDPSTREFKLRDPASVKVSGLNVINIPDDGVHKVSADLKSAQQKVADYLQSKGAMVKTIRLEKLKSSIDIWSSSIDSETKTLFRTLLGEGKGKDISPLWELIKLFFGASEHTLPSIVLALIENLPRMLPSRMKKFVDMGKELQKELIELIGPNGIMLYPPFPSVAPRHNAPLFNPFQYAYTAILNIMTFPVTVVPLGLNKDGLPLGVQVASIPGNDHITIGVALELEKAFGGWVPAEL